MTTSEFLRFQLDELGFQLDKVFEGVPEDRRNFRVADHAMSPEETLLHLCEVYFAFECSLDGKQHAWGSFKPADPAWEGLWAEFESSRNRVVHRACDDPSDDTLRHAHDYLIAHDAYHIGQMASCRLGMDPNWNPYCLYRGG